MGEVWRLLKTASTANAMHGTSCMLFLPVERRCPMIRCEGRCGRKCGEVWEETCAKPPETLIPHFLQ